MIQKSRISSKLKARLLSWVEARHARKHEKKHWLNTRNAKSSVKPEINQDEILCIEHSQEEIDSEHSEAAGLKRRANNGEKSFTAKSYPDKLKSSDLSSHYQVFSR